MLIYVFLTAAAIAACCLAGALAGFRLGNIPPRLEDSLTGAAAGIMLCAAVLGLVAPSLELGGSAAMVLTPLGVIGGAAFLSALKLLGPRLTGMIGARDDSDASRSAALFVAAIAIHHFPEGIAAGVSFGTDSFSDTLTVTAGIAFQNLPEAMVLIPPLLHAGTGKRRAAIIAVISGAVEVAGLFFGYLAVTLARGVLPFALAFAAGTMLFVIVDDMIPQSHRRGSARLASYATLTAFALTLFLTAL